MGKVGHFLLDEKTKVSLNIINFVILVGFVITASFTFAIWKTKQESEDRRLEIKINTEISQREKDVSDINTKLNEVMPLLRENQTDMAGIKTDLEWIKSMQVQIWEKMNK